MPLPQRRRSLPAGCLGKGRARSEAEEACETSAKNTVDAVSITDQMRALGPAAVVTELLIRLISVLRRIHVRTREQIGRHKAEVQAGKAVIDAGVSRSSIHQKVVELFVAAAE